jgi:hypothetical protein
MGLVLKAKRAVKGVGVSVLLAASALAIPLSATHSANALTAGIVTTGLALNLDPNDSASYPGTGTTVTDLSGANRHGTLAGTVLPTFNNVSPKSFQFTKTFVGSTASTDNKISIGSRFLPDDFTIQTWIKTNQVGYSSAHYTTMFIMASECGGGADDWGFGVDNSGKLAFGAGPNDVTIATPENVNTNAWVNVAASRNKTTGQIRLYINGALKNTGTSNSGNSLTCVQENQTWIGNGQDGPGETFGGSIGSVLAYTNVLSDADVLANYNATSETFYPVVPASSAAPVITGSARTGETLSVSRGSWTSAPTASTTYAYQWKRAATSGGSYENITSAVSNTYELTDSDIGKFIMASVTATNVVGPSTPALSAATSVVLDLNDSVVPTVSTPAATATGFTFTILNYSNLFTYTATTTSGSVTRTGDEVVVTGLSAGASATVTISVTRASYKPASKTIVGSAIPAPTTTTSTTVAPALSIVIQAPVTTVAQGQASVATVAPTTTTLAVSGAKGGPIPTTTTTSNPKKLEVASTTTTTTVVPPVVDKVSTGESAVQIDGVKTDATVTRENNQMVVTAGSLSATLSGLDKGGKTSPLDSDGNIHLAAGDVIKISVGGFKPGSLVEVWLFSTPTKLGSAVVGADGAINGLFSIPLGIESGSHRVVISAKLPNGKPTTFTLGILVGDISTTSTLTRVLIAIPITLAIGFGFLLPTQLRRRRKSRPA